MENIENIHIDTIEIGKELPLNMETISSLFSDYHYSDCCESHYTDWNASLGAIETAASILPTFDKLEIKGTPGMGFTLFFINGEKRFGVFFACYADNNGYYSSDLTLVYTSISGEKTEYDISGYQKW